MSKMILIDEATVKLALEALEVATTPLAKDRQEVLRAQAALREALAEQPAQQWTDEAAKVPDNLWDGGCVLGHCGSPTGCELSDRCRADCTSPQAQPAQQQEPCGWQFFQDGKWYNGMEINDHRANTEAAGIPVRDVYPSPPAHRTWVGLTEQEALDCFSPNPVTHSKNVEAKLKEKNT